MPGVLRSGSARRAVVLAVGALLIGGLAASEGSQAGVTVKGSVVFVDGQTGAVTAEATLPGQPSRCVVRTGTAWLTDYQRHALYRVDANGHRLVRTVALGFAPTGVAAGPDGVWVRGNDALVLINPSSSKVVKKISVPATPGGRSGGTFYSPVAESGGSLWVGDRLEILRIDLRTKKVVAANRKVTAHPNAFADGLGAMWAVDMGGVLYRLDPRSTATLKQTTINLDNSEKPTAVAVYADAVWVTDAVGDKAWKIDPTGTPSGSVGVGHFPVAIAPAGGYVWVADQNDNTLAQIEPGSATRTRLVPISHTPVALCGDATQLVVAAQ